MPQSFYFAANPLAWAPNLSLRITSHAEGGEATHDRILEGPAIRILQEAVAVIQQRTGRSISFPKGQLEREERPAYPLYALREGLVNAMVHRDYATSGIGVLVRIHGDRLEIATPGQLPAGWTTQDLGRKVKSHPWNPDIARVFHLRKLMDQLGLGTQRIVDECVAGGAKPPKWQDQKHTVPLTLFPSPMLTAPPPLNPRQEEFMKFLPPGARFKAADYETATSVSARQARRDLAALERMGVLERLGSGPSATYRFTGKS